MKHQAKYANAMILLALISCHEILLLAEGRQLQETTDGQDSISRHANDFLGYRNDFRPTAPGHSPGIGNPLVEGNKDTMVNKINGEKTDGQDSISGHANDFSVYPNDFRPTAPGHSPGIGNPLIEGNKDTMVNKIKGEKTDGQDSISRHTNDFSVYPNDFRPTAPGHSPGIGNPLIEGNKDTMVNKIKGEKAEGQDSISRHANDFSVYPNDFRPTVPGHSPGIGNPLVQGNKDTMVNKVKEEGNMGKQIAGFENGFKPTNPGHSHGVGLGHAVHNGKPNV